MKKVSVLGILMVVFWLMVIFFMFGDNNRWVCRHGEWVAVGEPKVPKPVMPCER